MQKRNFISTCADKIELIGVVGRAPTSLAPRLGREREIHGQFLLHESAAVAFLNSLLRLRELGVFQGCIAFHKPRPPVQVQVQVLDLAKVGELVHDVVLLRLLVDAGDEDDVTLDGCVRGWRALQEGEQRLISVVGRGKRGRAAARGRQSRDDGRSR